MNNIKLDDFKIGEVYGFIISNDQGESEEIKGCVTGHNHMQLEDAQADLIIIRNILNKSPIYILLDSIKSYYHLNRDNEEYIDAEVFNPALDEYNEYYGAAEPPVRRGVSHLSGLTEPLFIVTRCFLQALFPQKCRLNSSKLHGEFPHYCISSAGTLSGAGEEPLQAYKVY